MGLHLLYLYTKIPSSMTSIITITWYVNALGYVLSIQESVSDHFEVTQGFCSKLQPYMQNEKRSAVECLAFCLVQSKCKAAGSRYDHHDGHRCQLFESKSSPSDLVRNEKCVHYEKINLSQNEPNDCRSQYENGENRTGIHDIELEGIGTVQVYCVMNTSVGGWTVFHNRFDGSVDFNKPWDSYVKGFGDVSGEHWLGFDILLALMKQRTRHTLRIDLKSFDGVHGIAKYSTFKITGESYKLTVDGFSGTFEDTSIAVHNQTGFSTYDRGAGSDCANEYAGGWWYIGCFHVNLNGIYRSKKVKGAHTMSWLSFTGGYESLKSARMMFR